jgi:hypothetical protein
LEKFTTDLSLSLLEIESSHCRLFSMESSHRRQFVRLWPFTLVIELRRSMPITGDMTTLVDLTSLLWSTYDKATQESWHDCRTRRCHLNTSPQAHIDTLTLQWCYSSTSPPPCVFFLVTEADEKAYMYMYMYMYIVRLILSSLIFCCSLFKIEHPHVNTSMHRSLLR